MKYLALDLETTGTNPETCQILSIGVVLEDTETQLPINELPCFYKEVYPRDGILSGEPYALDMNKDIISRMKMGKTDDMIYVEEIVDYIWHFILSYGYIENELDYSNYLEESIFTDNLIASRNYNSMKHVLKLAGKNVGTFDLKFLNEIPNFNNSFQVSHRFLDPAMYYIQEGDTWLPNSQQCFDRAGLEKQVTHNALEDARDTIKLLRKKYHFWK